MGSVLDTLWSPLSRSTSLRKSSTDSLYQEKYRTSLSDISSCSRKSHVPSRPHSLSSSSVYDLDITSLSSIQSQSSSTTQSTRSLRRSRSKLSTKPSYSSDEELVMMSSVAQLERPPVQKAKLMSVPSLNPSESDLSSSSTSTLISSSDHNNGILITNIFNIYNR